MDKQEEGGCGGHLTFHRGFLKGNQAILNKTLPLFSGISVNLIFPSVAMSMLPLILSLFVLQSEKPQLSNSLNLTYSGIVQKCPSCCCKLKKWQCAQIIIYFIFHSFASYTQQESDLIWMNSLEAKTQNEQLANWECYLQS